jgi:hypothetical protein
MEPAQRITETREACPVHGLKQVTYDLTAGRWRCLGAGRHWPQAGGPETYTKAMRADLRRLGIDTEEGE